MPGQNPENLGLCAEKRPGIPEAPDLVMKDKTGAWKGKENCAWPQLSLMDRVSHP